LQANCQKTTQNYKWSFLKRRNLLLKNSDILKFGLGLHAFLDFRPLKFSFWLIQKYKIQHSENYIPFLSPFWLSRFVWTRSFYPLHVSSLACKNQMDSLYFKRTKFTAWIFIFRRKNRTSFVNSSHSSRVSCGRAFITPIIILHFANSHACKKSKGKFLKEILDKNKILPPFSNPSFSSRVSR
jgi:hypothetical protein